MTKETLKKILDRKIAEGAHYFDYNSLGFRHTPEVIIYGTTRDGVHEHRLDVRTLTEEFVDKLINEIEEVRKTEKAAKKFNAQIDEIMKARTTTAHPVRDNFKEDTDDWKKGLTKWRPITSVEEVTRRKQAYTVYLEGYCQGLPDFVPATDRCFHCHKDVFTDYEDNHGRISRGEIGDRYITGCRHCHQTFCD